MATEEKILEWQAAIPNCPDIKFDKPGGEPVIWYNCSRCGGKGFIYGMAHVERGVCFGCGGSRGRFRSLQRVASAARAAVRRQEKLAAERQHGSQVRRQKRRGVAADARSFLAETSGLAAALAGSRVGIMRSFALQLAQRGTLSEKQVEVALKIAADMGCWGEGVMIPVPEGRMTVEGEVITVKEYENHFTGGTDLKMLVMDARGFKVFGSVPSTLSPLIERGVKIRFDAALTAKELGFGFFKRPTKVEVLD